MNEREVHDAELRGFVLIFGGVLIALLNLILILALFVVDVEITSYQYLKLEESYINCHTHVAVTTAMADGVILRSEYNEIKAIGPGKYKALLLDIMQKPCPHLEGLHD